MVTGYTVPRTPLGLASIDPPPPWHYSSDVVGIEYWADPEAVSAVLPEGFRRTPRRMVEPRLCFSTRNSPLKMESILIPPATRAGKPAYLSTHSGKRRL